MSATGIKGPRGCPGRALRVALTCRPQNPVTRWGQGSRRRLIISAVSDMKQGRSPPAVVTNDDYVPPLTNDMWNSFLKPYRSAYEERAFTVSDDMIQGTIPAELKGTLLRNGPGLFEIGGKKIPQPFDGDGKVAMFCFKGDGANPFFSTR